MDLLERALPRLRCPDCGSGDLGAAGSTLECAGCSARYPLAERLVDFHPGYRAARSGAQLAMESRFIAGIYEKHWRPWFTSLGSRITYADEEAWLLRQDDRTGLECVLDVGAGTGRYARILSDAQRPELALALDLSAPMLEKGRDVALEAGYDRILFVKADAQRLPLRDASVDRVNCFGALHLFPEPARAIEELGRVARPGTVFTCLTAGRTGAPTAQRARGWFSNMASFHFFEPAELEKRLEAAGFERFACEWSGAVLLFSAVRGAAA